MIRSGLSRKLVLVGNTLAWFRNQAFTYTAELLQIIDVQPPPPQEVPVNSEGVQELNLTITPGGFVPIRFEVQKGIPSNQFRALGEVGCGNTIMVPTEGLNYAALEVTKADVRHYNLTPDEAGQFKFF